jgi:fatty acid desaturase
MLELTGWENFYVIVGSSAGALLGLQFVAISIIAGTISQDMERASRAFATPTIVHFVSVLIVSAIITAPWHSIVTPAILWGLMGLCGLAYVVIVARRMRLQTAYSPELEDRLFHVVLPLVAYATLAVSAFMVLSRAREALFGVATAALMLLLVGIHNTWDAVTYHLFTKTRQANEHKKEDATTRSTKGARR